MGDYLWDKTGAADPEVERLEDLLGAFAHRPRPLELPPEAAARPRSGFRMARLAAAAAILLAVLAGALVVLRQVTRVDTSVAESERPREVEAPRESLPPTPAPPEERQRAAGGEGPRQHERRVPEIARGPKRARRSTAVVRPRAPERVEDAPEAQAAAANAERLRAKEQLVYALRLTSAKLGEVRRKVQGEDESPAAREGRGRTR